MRIPNPLLTTSLLVHRVWPSLRTSNTPFPSFRPQIHTKILGRFFNISHVTFCVRCWPTDFKNLGRTLRIVVILLEMRESLCIYEILRRILIIYSFKLVKSNWQMLSWLRLIDGRCLHKRIMVVMGKLMKIRH